MGTVVRAIGVPGPQVRVYYRSRRTTGTTTGECMGIERNNNVTVRTINNASKHISTLRSKITQFANQLNHTHSHIHTPSSIFSESGMDGSENGRVTVL